MDRQRTTAAQNSRKYDSKFFPPSSIILNLANHADQEPFMHLVRETILYHMRNGNPLIRLWKDAYDAELAGCSTNPYSQYLMAVRKTTGQMLNKEFNKKDAESKARLQADACGALENELPSAGAQIKVKDSMESPRPIERTQARFSPLAPTFAPGKTPKKPVGEPSAKEESYTTGKGQTDTRFAKFEERCRKRGVRIAPAK
ncbi:hypothetical protein F5Y11DRAFT_80541 [Daldinia sp. FL1419]|nr:hypothetical protein F5Y11DRAFT_80541 [Daldinia sp. FL1419]